MIRCRARVHAIHVDWNNRTLCRGQQDVPICKEAARLQPLCCGGSSSPAQDTPADEGATEVVAEVNYHLSVEIYSAHVSSPKASFLPRHASGVFITSISILAGIVVGGAVGVVCGKIVLIARRNRVHLV